jgi:hypothetical protein
MRKTIKIINHMKNPNIILVLMKRKTVVKRTTASHQKVNQMMIFPRSTGSEVSNVEEVFQVEKSHTLNQ